MTDPKALQKLWDQEAVRFFFDRPHRYCHIRKPYQGECEAEFRSLGDHVKDRRRIFLWRVPADNYFYNPDHPQIMKIPFLLFADETVEDTDEVLRPIVHEIMMDAAKNEKLVGH